jgi:hypothetical protein
MQRRATVGAFCSVGNLAAGELKENLAQFDGSHETSTTSFLHNIS